MGEVLGVAGSPTGLGVDMLAVVVGKKAVEERRIPGLSGELAGKAGIPIGLGDFDGSLGSTALVYTGLGEASRLLLVGGGGGDDWEDAVERLRVGVGKAVSVAKQYRRVKSLGIVVDPELLGDSSFAYREALVAAGLANYVFHRKGRTEAPHRLERIVLVAGDAGEEVVEAARGIVDAVYVARDIANAPPAEMNPERLEETARRIAEKEGLGIRVFHRSELESMGMGGILAVGSGSSVEPRLIVLEYDGGGSRTVAIVGKAVTFDSGGLDLKSEQGMYDMKFDKSGGAAAIGAIVAAKRLRLPLRVVALVPAVENMPGGSAYKPRDVLHMYNGLTVEVGNTDAEGRLILADALAYAVEKYRPDYVVDLATLTGTIVRALGNLAAGLFSNNDEAASLVERAAWRVWEPVWRLPLWKPYYRQLESSVADTDNVDGPEAGAITAAAFLSKFVEDTPWVHLDIAGVAWTQKWGPSKPYYPKGATGWGVRTLAEFMTMVASGEGKD